MTFLISLDSPFNNQVVTMSLQQLHCSNSVEVGSGALHTPFMKPNFFFADKEINTDLLHPG
ncbi:hypothetical protein RND71_039616 [Anisodus tanguticus]|uniref:Uncharacterized protein n=1 Tax=Anisodus tanguticus TaxID=243964 RepID=A0AAE1QWX9_9SOLA|nr:hypothetical protein RND71_039616 [Anisodus tanguticus]